LIKFSIITVVKNDKKNILKTLNCIKNQTFKNFEHIIFDSNSTDGTSQLISKNLNSNTIYYATATPLPHINNQTGVTYPNLDMKSTTPGKLAATSLKITGLNSGTEYLLNLYCTNNNSLIFIFKDAEIDKECHYKIALSSYPPDEELYEAEKLLKKSIPYWEGFLKEELKFTGKNFDDRYNLNPYAKLSTVYFELYNYTQKIEYLYKIIGLSDITKNTNNNSLKSKFFNIEYNKQTIIKLQKLSKKKKSKTKSKRKRN
jgi:hypothetical protein